MKKNIVLVDLDNTMFDLLDGIKNQFNWFDPQTQTSYSFFDTHPEKARAIYALFSDLEFFTQLEPIAVINTYVRNLMAQGYEVQFYSNKDDSLHTGFQEFFNEWLIQHNMLTLDRQLPPLFLWHKEADLKVYLDRIQPYIVEVIDDYPDKLKGYLETINLTIPKWPYNQNTNYEHIKPLTLSYLDH